MKQNLLKCLSVLMCLSFVSCNENTPSDVIHNEVTNQTEADTPYKLSQSENMKATIIDSNGVPQVVLSSLLRTDLLMNADFLSPSQMEDYFALGAATNMNTLEISVMWSEIETSYDQYNYDDLKYYLDFAKKYGLKLNIEWYGSFTDGEYHSVNVPSYINNNPSTYPVIKDMFDFANYGRCKIMDWSNDNLLNREQKAIYNMMNYIYEWNHQNDMYNPVMMVQIGQGVDRFQRWRIEAYKVTGDDGLPLSADTAWSMAQKYLNTVAQGVKYSKYKALTRAEFCEQNAVVNYVRNIEKLDNIDIVSPTYLHEVSLTKNGVKSFTDEYDDIPIINAENWANDINYKQILATFAMGGTGYVSYQLACPNYFPESPNGAIYNRYNENGTTLAEKFIQKNTRADDTKQIYGALNKAYVAVANAPRSSFAAFGLDNRLSDKLADARIQRIYMSNGLLLEYSNPENSIGFAINDGNYLYVFASKDSTLTIENCSIPAASKGYFDATGEWVNEGAITLESNKILSITKDELYRVRISNILDLPSMTSLEESGYKSILDSIRG